LVVPKRHVTNVRELTDKEVESLFRTVRLVSLKLKKCLKPDGFNYGFNEGEYSGQMVEHFHFHIMPRFSGDKLPKFHLFHRDPKTKRNLPKKEFELAVEKFRKLFPSFQKT
jgi:diadenosine tetraphosphate (Ap4A) HIT family hydrolase